ncbi:endonuclease/exonuclease/phosphatase family protein [Tamlana agarivorans]|uniref:Endonuclease/exonuclease/phosphatase family protein n=1 Tax=Pseudotamlana agarivorans TaxID=481183 RepID=A0ACC5U7Z8_9FLAO|nr:endonuclease/exonuclease/phosphatase family protein [Tamlana agarivorans]MBU2950451.1 endonuclease/exonuclease/phosphatase family protein [Tamlana agarivorans]
MRKFIRGSYRILNVIIIIALLMLHFIIKDRTYELSLLFYPLPLPVIILIVLGLSIFLGKWRKYNLFLAGLLLVIWLGRSFRFSIAEPIKDSDIEIVFWNTSRVHKFKDAITQYGDFPDVMVLAEASDTDFKDLQKKYPDYSFYKSTRELSIFSKHPMKIISDVTSNYHTSVVHFETCNLHFYAVDVTGSRDVPRHWELDYVDAHLEFQERTIVLGDFNLPYESVYFEVIRAQFNHWFSSKGNGFRETWPWELPLLSLDHIWVSKDLEILDSKKINSLESDHEMIKTVVLRE